MTIKIGTCTNCQRPDLIIADKDGHCHTCYAAGKDLDGEDLRIALVNTKFRIGTKLEGLGRPEPEEKLSPIETKPLSPASIVEINHHVNRTKPGIYPDNEIITLIFESESDKSLLKSLKDRAVIERRTLDQQIMWMVRDDNPG